MIFMRGDKDYIGLAMKLSKVFQIARIHIKLLEKRNIL